MRQAKIHLGLPKTGTTSLQNVLTNNSGKFSYQGKFSDESYTSLYNFIFYGSDLKLDENSLPINILLSNEDIFFELMYAEKAESSDLIKKIYGIIERSESIGYITEFYVFYRPIRTYIKSFYAQVYIPYLVNTKYRNFEIFLDGFYVQKKIV